MSGSFMAIDPATGHEFAELPSTSPEQVKDFAQDARRALAVEHDWRSPYVRSRALARLARRVEDHADSLADLETRDTGTPLSQAREHVQATIRWLDAVAGEPTDGGAAVDPSALDYRVREPWGVCGQLICADAPLRATARCAAPALAAGNAVILKPSESASITPLRLAQLAEEAGVPRGLFQVATGDAATGATLVNAVDHVTFAGSARTAAKVAEACGRRLAPIRLELRGTPLTVVFADADTERVVVRPGSRLLVHRDAYEAVTTRVGQALAGLRVGAGIEDPDVGPLISPRRLARAAALLEAARGHGARVLGGATDARFMHPALVTRVKADMEIFQAELAGPVVVALAFDDERHAVALANAAGHADAAAVWTNDLARAHRVAAGLRAERVGVNGAAPEGGPDPLAYTRRKQVRVTLGAQCSAGSTMPSSSHW